MEMYILILIGFRFFRYRIMLTFYKLAVTIKDNIILLHD